MSPFLHTRCLSLFLASFAVVTVNGPMVLKAETVADRKAAVLNDRAAMEKDPRWIYNDFERGFAEGRRTGKPVLIVLRCIPCLACAGIDARVLLDRSDLDPLLDQFVCVRVINANALDLSRFQFDFDLSFTTLIFNGDGTVYGRYGSWLHQRDPKEKAIDGFRTALEGALALHKKYPANKESLAGKQPHPSAYATPVDMPTLQGRYTRTLDWQGKVVQSCVHCHQIGDAQRELTRQKTGLLPPDLIYPYPSPETLGFTLAPSNERQVQSLRTDSPAATAGILPGDELLRVQGQPLVSAADLSWMLHGVRNERALEFAIRRGGVESTLNIPLAPDWRFKSDIARRVGTWQMRAMALGGMLLEDLTEAQRTGAGLKPSQFGLVAKHVGEYGEHATAKKRGFKKGDILLEVAGQQDKMTESELIGHLLTQFKPGDAIRVTVLRSGDRLEMSYPIQ